MARLLQRTFRKNKNSLTVHAHGVGALCRKGFIAHLRRWFDLPYEASCVTVSLHTLPGTDRVKARVRRWGEGICTFPVLESDEGHELTLQEIRIDDLLRPFVGQTVYVQVEYE